MTETFTVPAKIKRLTFIMIAIGVLGAVLGFFAYSDHTRLLANLLVCSYYSVGICLGATFFLATHQIGYGGWHVLLRRVPEAFGVYIPVGGAILLLTVLVGGHFDHHLYHWMNPALYVKGGTEYDSILDNKKGFLNMAFFAFRVVCYVILWSGTSYLIRNISRKEDEVGILQTYKRSKILSALFIVVFAVTESTGAWDFIMSTDPHWYSTLFGWYNFASYTVAAFSAITLVVAYVKSLGYLQRVNEEHVHNLGMFMFGFSVFWTYLWFSQYMLQWYANIPEETIYFSKRFDNPFFHFLLVSNVLINFFLPFFMIMRRKAKRNLKHLSMVAVCLLVGHYIDFYMMVMPNSVGNAAGFGWLELSIICGFVGLFIAVVLNGLTKASLTPVNNPYLKESIQHHTIK